MAGDLAYCSVGWNGFYIVDTQCPTNPVALARHKTVGQVYDLWAEGTDAYVAEGWEGLTIVDVTQPTRTLRLGNVPTCGEARGVQVLSNCVYVAEAGGGLTILKQFSKSGLMISESPLDVSVAAGSPATLIVRAYGRGPLSYQWYRGQAGDTSQPIPGATGPVFTTPEVGQPCSYWVRVSSGFATVDSQAAWVKPLPPVPVELVSLWPGYKRGSATRARVEGNLAYIAVSGATAGGMQIWDVADLTSPHCLGSYDLKSTSVNDLWLSGQLVFLAGGDGLRIVDVSTPAVPVCRSSYTNGYVNSVTVVGRYAYLLGDGLHVLDISDPAQPREVGMLAGVWGSCIIVRGTSAYVTSSGNSLQVIDVTDPAQPRLVGALATNRNMSRVDVAGQYAYVTVPPYWDYINGNSVRYAGYLAVIDISDSAHPRLTFTLTVEGDACDVVVSGQQAYLADGGAGLKVVDIRLPNSPMIIASATSIQPAQSVCVSGPAAYVATYDAGLQVMDISNAYSPRLMGTVTTTGFAQSVVVSGRYAYLADGVRGLQVLDITDPQQPTLSGGCRDVWPTSVTVAGQRLFLVPFQVLDITDPTRPQALGTIDDNSCVNVALDGDVAYLTGYPGLRTVDVSQPAVPTVLGGFALSGGGHGIGFRDRYACVGCDWSGLQIFDIASPAEPRRVGTYYPDGSVMDVVVRSNTAYATLTEDPGLEVIDVTDPQRPTRISSLPLPVATNVAITAGNYACVTGDGLEVIDLGDPAHPVLVGRHQLGTATYGLQVAGDLAYVAAGEYGLAIYRLTPELKLQALTRVAGGLNLSWLGGPGIRLQRATSLSNPDWQDVPNSDGANSIRLPPSGAAGFYRLVRK